MLANTVALGLLTLLRVAVAAPLEPRWSTDLLGESCKRKLTFGRDGHFKVVSFSDLHYGERDGDIWVAWGPEQDVNTTKVQASILDYEKPNYVLYNGDLVTGEGLLKDNATVYLDQCFSEAVKRNIPFSSSHGNHDNSFNITHQQEINYETQKYGGFDGLSYTRSDVGPKPYGSGNYWVPVYARPHDRVPALVIWIFDSRSFVPGGSETEGAKSWVDPQTVPPYIYSQGDLMKRRWGSIPPSLVYVHIPLQKSQIVANLMMTRIRRLKDTDYTGLDLPFFDALVWLDQKKGNVLAVTSGHDHGDSWCGKIQTSGGLTLCFNGHAGYGGYTTKNSQVRNGRVFDLTLADLRKSRPTVKTYNSYEDQTRNEFVELGPKFGKK